MPSAAVAAESVYMRESVKEPNQFAKTFLLALINIWNSYNDFPKLFTSTVRTIRFLIGEKNKMYRRVLNWVCQERCLVNIS